MLKADYKKQLLDKYGGGEHLEKAPQELLFGQSEAYVQYSRDGKVVKGEVRFGPCGCCAQLPLSCLVPKSRFVPLSPLDEVMSVWASFVASVCVVRMG